jgi:DNA (cytosine-5)-methyltransferase 1
MNKLKLLDLFSGIGGFSYGLESTNGFETIAFCEKDKFCQKVLKKHWNDIKIYEDVRHIKGKEIKADVITGGFPCQPFSVAGKQRGTDDDRYLWDETLRVIAETKPKWFVGENVEGIVNIQEGKVLQQIQKDLEAESFQVQCLIIPASGFGAWHQRKRVWIIGYSEHNGSFTSEIKRRNSEVNERTSERKNEALQSERTSRSSNDGNVSNSSTIRRSNNTTDNKENGSKEFSKEDVKLGIKSSLSSNVSNSNTGLFIGENKEIQTRRIASNNGSKNVSNSNEQRTQIPIERKYSGEQMSGSDSSKSWWKTQSELCGVPNGVSYGLDKDRANRIKSLGNSIVPEIAKEIGLAILEAEYE